MLTTSKYTPFATLSIATRYFCNSKSGYFFRFNGKEKDSETYGDGNALDFGARIYDSRLGRRWNVDPVHQKFPTITPYNALGNNPMYFIDPNGDELDVPADDAQAKKDLKSLTRSQNSKYVIIDDQGKVKIDWSKAPKRIQKDPVKFEAFKNKKLDKDKGLELLSKLANAKKKFFYSTKGPFGFQSDPTQEGKFGEPYQDWGKKPGQISTNLQDYFQNASTTRYDCENQKPHLMPKAGYDGQIAIAPGSPYYQTIVGGTPAVIVVREELIFHELEENYLRTVDGLFYDEAHKKARGIKEIKYFIW